MTQQRPESTSLPDQVIKLPTFKLPFPDEISQFADSVMDHSSRWALAVGLVPDEAAVQRLRRNNIMHAGPRLVPAAPMSAACLVCDWTVFLIVIDDEFDDGPELYARPDLAQAAINDVVAAFRGQANGDPSRLGHLAGVSAAAADLGSRFAAISPSPAWLSQFMAYAEDHIWSKVSEAKQRESGVPLDTASYVDLRRISSAAYSYAALVELAAGIRIAEPVRETPAWRLLLDAFADVWLGIQDICSCAKEVASGDDLNIAAVLALSTGNDLQHGIDDAYRWIRERSISFAGRRAQLIDTTWHLGLGEQAETDLVQYLDALELLLGGHLAWNSQDNPRYLQVVARS